MKARWYTKLLMVVVAVGVIAGLVAGCGTTTQTVTQTTTATTTQTTTQTLAATTQTVTQTVGAGVTVTVTASQPGATVTVTQTAPGGTVTVTKTATPTAAPVYSKVKLKIASPWTTAQRFLQAGIKWMDEITKATNGSVTFETYWGGTLATPSESLNLLITHDVDMVESHMWYSPTMFPIGNFDYSYPFGPSDPGLLVKAYRQLRAAFPQVEGELLKNNGILIMTQPSDTYNLLSKTPITSTADLKGKKIAAIGRFFGKWVGEPVGATALVSQITERYTSLQTNLEDVDVLTPTMWVAYKLYEQAKYLVDVPLGAYYGTGQLWINKDSFAALTPDTQKLFLDLGLQLEQEWYPAWMANEEKLCLDTMKAAGVTVWKVPEDQKVAWAAKVPDTVLEWVADAEKVGLPGYDIAQKWQEITASLGFKWARQWGVKP